MLSVFSIVTFSQSITFKKMLAVAKTGGADTYLTSLGFTKGKDFNGLEVYTLNAGTTNEEHFRYNPRGSSYETNNTAYLKAIEQQVKKRYKLILREDLNKNEIYCEYGTADLRLVFSFSKKATRLSRLDIPGEKKSDK